MEEYANSIGARYVPGTDEGGGGYWQVPGRGDEGGWGQISEEALQRLAQGLPEGGYGFKGPDGRDYYANGGNWDYWARQFGFEPSQVTAMGPHGELGIRDDLAVKIGQGTSNSGGGVFNFFDNTNIPALMGGAFMGGALSGAFPSGIDAGTLGGDAAWGVNARPDFGAGVQAAEGIQDFNAFGNASGTDFGIGAQAGEGVQDFNAFGQQSGGFGPAGSFTPPPSTASGGATFGQPDLTTQPMSAGGPIGSNNPLAGWGITPGTAAATAFNLFTQNQKQNQLNDLSQQALNAAPINQAQRLPYQADLLQLMQNPSSFFATNPLFNAQKDQATQAFQAQYAKNGMGGTSIDAYMKNIMNAGAGTFFDQGNLLSTLGGFNQGAGNAGAGVQAGIAGANAGQAGLSGLAAVGGNVLNSDKANEAFANLFKVSEPNAVSGASTTFS